MTSSASRALVAERTKQIVNLHLGIEASLRRSVQDAIRLGELLTEQKAALPHGDFLPWLERELPFSERTARNYMKLFEYRTKTATVADLRTAYEVAQIEDQRQHPKPRPRVAPEVVEQQKQRHEAFVIRIAEQADEPEPEPQCNHEDLLRRAKAAQEQTLREKESGVEPDQMVEQLKNAIGEAVARVHGLNGQHMIINEMIKYLRELSIELNRKAGAA